MNRYLFDDPKPRRFKMLKLNMDNLLEFLRSLDGTRAVLVRGIPEDAKVVGFKPSADMNFIEMYVESEEFEPQEYYGDKMALSISFWSLGSMPWSPLALAGIVQNMRKDEG